MEIDNMILENLQQISKKQDGVASRITEIDSAAKKAMDEIALLQRHANDTDATVAQVRKLIETFEQRNRIVQRSMYERDPIKRIVMDDDRRAYIMGALRKAANLPLSDVQKTAITGIDSGIGAAVTPQETASMIYDALLTYGQWNTLGVMPIGSRTQIVPVMTVRPVAYWIAQGAQITEGAMTGSSVTMTVGDACAWIPMALSLLDDDSVDMAGYIVQQLVQAVALRLDWACFAADGTADSTDGSYTGIAVGGTAANAAAGNTTVANLDLDDFVRCLTTVSAGCLQRACKWWIHPQIIAKLALVRDQNGRPIFQNANDAPSNTVGSILGYPVIPTAAMPSTDAISSVVAVFGDPDGCAVGVRKDMNLARSDEFQFDYNRAAFRCVTRAGVVIKAATSFAMLTTPAA
jgi:HK97 family phage major capsid protein